MRIVEQGVFFYFLICKKTCGKTLIKGPSKLWSAFSVLENTNDRGIVTKIVDQRKSLSSQISGFCSHALTACLD